MHPDAPVHGSPGLGAVIRRELGRIFTGRIYLFLLLLLPLASFAILIGIFWRGVPRDLPIAVVDLDHSALSRQLVRMLDATSSMAVRYHPGDFEAGRKLILEGKAYAIVLIPCNLERDVQTGRAPPVSGYYNAQLLLPASIIRRDLRQTVGTLSAGIELRARMARGETQKAALAYLEPIQMDRHTLFNPQLNYITYLLATLLPTMMQIFILLAAIHAFGIELKEGTAADWLATAGDRVGTAIIGKFLPYTVNFIALGLFMIVLLFVGLGIPFAGSHVTILIGTVLFVLASQAVGLLAVAWTANLRFATSFGAFYSGPAFAFTGTTFPVMAMPTLGKIWGALIPLSHYLRLMVEQAIRNAGVAASLPEMAALALFILIAPVLAWPRLRPVMTDPRWWGHL